MYYNIKIINSSRLVSNHATSRNLQDIAYNKYITTLCITSHRNRVITSNCYAWCRNQPIFEPKYL